MSEKNRDDKKKMAECYNSIPHVTRGKRGVE